MPPDYVRAGQRSARFAGDEALQPWLVYGGDDAYERSGVRVIGWRGLADVLAAARERRVTRGDLSPT